MKTFKEYLQEQREIILEGGNVFKGKTASIKLEYIAPTLAAYFEELKHIFPKKANIFNLSHFEPLGSVGKKKISGDIDLGIDSKSLLDHTMSDHSMSEWGIDPKAVHIEFAKLEKRAKTASPEMLLMKAFLKELTLYINSHAPTLYCDPVKVTNGNIFGLYPQINEKGEDVGIGVQIDWLIGSMKWLTFSYHSDVYPEGSTTKGLHATQGILALFQIVNMSFNHTTGVKDKVTGDVIASDPDKALEVLSKALKVDVTVEDRNNFYKLFDVVKKLPKSKYDQWVDTYLKILDSTRCDVPDVLQHEWKKRKEKLGLTGKYLPMESLLRQ
jgi:hypothetical protein